MAYDAFLSYAHHDDLHEGTVTALRSELERFTGAHFGRPASIFQDKAGLLVGQIWQTELQCALRCPSLVPIITPAYLNSDNCINEFIEFCDLEAKRQETARILPLYFIEVPALEHRLGRPGRLLEPCNERQLRVVDILMQRQMEDIRWLRISPRDALSTREGREMLDRVAKQIAVRSSGASATPTIVVSPNGTDLRSISTAVRRAEPGSRILVKGPAEYRESLFIDKPLQIIGEPGVTLVGVNGPAIACTGSPVRIAGMRITSEGFNGVIISSGYCVLEQSEVSRTRNSAVLIRDGGEAAIIQCSLHHAEHCGLHAQHGSRCTVMGSTIRENHIGGLFFSQDAGGLVEGNLIEHNRVNGMYIAAGANPRIRHNRIRHHTYAGILVYRHWEFQGYGPGRGIIEDNEISGGSRFGIEIKEGGDPCVRRNVITANAWGGILIHEGGCGIIYENRIVDNAGSGIKNQGGHPRVGKNLFSGNAGQSVEDHGGAIQDEDAHCGE